MLAVIALAALVANAEAPPVRVAGCEVVEPNFVQLGDASTVAGRYALRVRFADSAPLPASRVMFTLSDGTSVTDVGTFSPGVTIAHTFDIAPTDATSCSVTAVTLADGTTWRP